LTHYPPLENKGFGAGKMLARGKPVYTDGHAIKLEIRLMTFPRSKVLVRENSTQSE